MKKSELKELVKEALKGYSKYVPGGETEGGTTDDFRNILTTIAKSVPKEEDSEEETISENSINFNEEEIQQQFPDLDLHYGFKGGNMGEIRSIRKQHLTDEQFEGIISFLEDRGYTVLRNKSTKDLDWDDDRYWYPSIIFTAPTEA